MSDLVEELRSHLTDLQHPHDPCRCWLCEVLRKAADRIEALEAALRGIEKNSHICGVTTSCGAIALRALEGKT